MYLVVGLGNPGEEYQNSRHNVGRMAVENLRRKLEFSKWKLDPKSRALVSAGRLGKQMVFLAQPETFMNQSGQAAKKLVTACRTPAANLIVVHDDFDLPLGKIRISFNRGAGGHRGVESVEKSLKTRKFARVRIGVSPATPGGKLKKPRNREAAVDFILGKFRPAELMVFKKASREAVQAVEEIISAGLEAAMNWHN